MNSMFGEKQGLEDQHALNGASLFIPAISPCLETQVGGLRQPCTQAYVVTPTLTASMATPLGNGGKDDFIAIVPTLAFDARQTDVCVYGDKTGSLDTDPGTIGVCVTGDRTHALTTRSAAEEDRTGRGTPIVPSGMSVRRLTPTECERLQGFPDGWTAIPWKGKPASECPDGPRYRALGNSMAVNVMRWIGRRIEMVDAL